MSAKDDWLRSGTAKTNGDFIALASLCGYVMAIHDPEAEVIVLAPDVPDDALGEAVRRALSRSRHVGLKAEQALRPRSTEAYERWVSDMLDRHRYRSRRALFQNMRDCGLTVEGGKLRMTPMHHKKLELWTRTEGDGIEDVEIPASASAAKIGAALRLAFSRCT